MAKIHQDEQQLLALEEITQELNELDLLNHILNDKENGTFNLTYSSDIEKKPLKIKFMSNDHDGKKIKKALQDKRQRMAKSIEAKSKKYKITLEDADLAILLNEIEDTSESQENA